MHICLLTVHVVQVFTIDIRPMVTEDIVFDDVERSDDQLAKIAGVNVNHRHL